MDLANVDRILYVVKEQEQVSGPAIRGPERKTAQPALCDPLLRIQAQQPNVALSRPLSASTA
jgi:hypothetical protein